MTIPMPEPVAWVRRHPDGALTAEFLEDAVISPVRKQSGAWLPMITTTQAEAYVAAKVREALEEVAVTVEQYHPKATPKGIAAAIRLIASTDVLIAPPLPGPASQT